MLEELGIDPARGLSEAEARRRREEHGSNELVETGARGLGRILWEQLSGAMVLLLAAAGVIDELREQLGGERLVFTKGAFDRLLDVSGRVWTGGRAEPLDDEWRERLAAAHGCLLGDRGEEVARPARKARSGGGLTRRTRGGAVFRGLEHPYNIRRRPLRTRPEQRTRSDR